MPVEEKISVLCFTASILPPIKGEARVVYMQDYEVLNDKETIGIPAV